MTSAKSCSGAPTVLWWTSCTKFCARTRMTYSPAAGTPMWTASTLLIRSPTGVPAAVSPSAKALPRKTRPSGPTTSRSRSLTSAGIAAGKPGTSVYTSVTLSGSSGPTTTRCSATCPVASPAPWSVKRWRRAESIRFTRLIRPQPSSVLGTGPVSPTTIPVSSAVSLSGSGTTPVPMSSAELMSSAFTSAGEGVAPLWVERYHWMAMAQAPLAWGPACEVPPWYM